METAKVQKQHISNECTVFYRVFHRSISRRSHGNRAAGCISACVSGTSPGTGSVNHKWHCDEKVYNKRKHKPVIIPSGGQGGDETISEAEAMKQYLLAHGIPEEHIIPEDQSKNTMDNLQNSKDIIFSKEGKHRVALVTSNYHVYRCLLYAKSLKMKCTGIGAPVAWYYWPSAVIREFVAVFTTKKILICTLIGYFFVVLLPAFGYAKMI